MNCRRVTFFAVLFCAVFVTFANQAFADLPGGDPVAPYMQLLNTTTDPQLMAEKQRTVFMTGTRWGAMASQAAKERKRAKGRSPAGQMEAARRWRASG